MSRRYRPDAGARFSRLRNDPQLVVQAPAPPSFPAVDDLNLTVRHLCKVDLKVHFKVVTSAIPRPPNARRQSPEAYAEHRATDRGSWPQSDTTPRCAEAPRLPTAIAWSRARRRISAAHEP